MFISTNTENIYYNTNNLKYFKFEYSLENSNIYNAYILSQKQKINIIELKDDYKYELIFNKNIDFYETYSYLYDLCISNDNTNTFKYFLLNVYLPDNKKSIYIYCNCDYLIDTGINMLWIKDYYDDILNYNIKIGHFNVQAWTYTHYNNPYINLVYPYKYHQVDVIYSTNPYMKKNIKIFDDSIFKDINETTIKVWSLGYLFTFSLIYIRDKVLTNMHKNDYFIIVDWWHIDKTFVNNLLINCKYIENILWLANGANELKEIRKSLYLNETNSILCSHNSFIDKNAFEIKENTKKVYDSIFLAEIRENKRPYLTKELDNILYITYKYDRELVEKWCSVKGHLIRQVSATESYFIYLDTFKEEVRNYECVNDLCKLINSARVGLMLSASEGGNYSSTEYLLCGIPVISTKSSGGRDTFFDDYNTIYCEDNCESVKECIEKSLSKTYDPYKIRNDCISKMDEQKNNLKKYIQKFVGNDISDDIFMIYKKNNNAFYNNEWHTKYPFTKGATTFQPELDPHFIFTNYFKQTHSLL